VILGVHSIVARNIDPNDAAVLSFGAIQAGSAKQYSVMPASVEMFGTVRTYSPNVQNRIEELLNKIVSSTCAAFGTTGTVEFQRWYPATVNHAREASIAVDTAAQLFGPQNALSTAKPSTAGEDFAFMLRHVPGAYIWIGQGGEGKVSLHSPFYDFDDRLITRGAALLARIVERELAP
jgi:hippurate hydrolase